MERGDDAGYHDLSMATEDGDPGAKAAPPPSSDDDAFAATVAPAPTLPIVPSKLPAGTVAAAGHTRASQARIAADETVAAPIEGSLPPLPQVSRALYTLD